MWTRDEMKRRGLEGLKTYFWYAILASVIVGVVGGSVNGIAFGISFLLKWIPFVGGKLAAPLTTLATGFVTLMLAAGFNRFLILSQRQHASAGVGTVFSAYDGKWFRYVAETEFMHSAVIGLWSAAFVVPGVIKFYEYLMVSFLVAEHPDQEGKDLFKISRDMMNGHKKEAFIMDLTFIGWYLLGMIPCGLGVPVAALYHSSARIELYFTLKDAYLASPEGREYAAFLGEAGRSGGFRPAGGYTAVPAGSGEGYRSVSGGASGPVPQIPVAPGAAVSRSGYLVGTQGEFAGARVPVGVGDTIIIGSDAARCSLVIHGSQVSPVHLKIQFNGTAFLVTDYSEAGTYNLQGGRLPGHQQVTLQPGTYLQVGNGGDVFSLESR